MLILEKLEQKRVYIISIMLVCILLGVIYSVCFIPKEYVASTTMLLLNIEKDAEENTKSSKNIELSSNIVSTLEEIIKSESTMDKVKEDLSLEITNKELHKRIDVKRISDSDTLKIEIKYKDKEIASKIAEEIVDIFSEKIKATFGNTEIYIVDTAHIVKETYGLAIFKVIILSILGGIVASFIYILFSIRIDTMIKNKQDIEAELALKNLISIPLNYKRRSDKVKSELVAYENDKTLIAKKFKQLRSNIQFINVKNKEKNIILITSPRKNEGKSYIAANMALSFAEVGKKVILIDADMNTGRQGKIFNIPDNLGLSNYLSNLDPNGTEINNLINRFINETAIKNLNVITSGTKPPNSSELLALPKMLEMIKDLSVFYDVVIIDGTSVLLSVDSLILTRMATSTILVSDYKKTKKDDLWKAKKDIQNVGGKISGVLINKTRTIEKADRTPIDKKELWRKFKLSVKTIWNLIKKCVITIVKVIKIIIKFIKNLIEKIKNRTNKRLLTDGKTVIDTSEAEEMVNIEATQIKDSKENIKDEQEKQIEEKEEVTQMTINELNMSSNEMDTNVVPTENLEKPSNQNLNQFEKENLNEVSNEIVENSKIIPNMQTEDRVFPGITAYETSKKFNPLEILGTIKETASSLFKKMKSNKNESNFIDELPYYAEPGEEAVVDEESENTFIKNNKSNRKINTTDSIKDIQKAINNRGRVIGDEEIDDETILVIVSANDGLCRAFNKYCFTEKLVRGIDKNNGFIKAHYSSYLLRKRVEGLIFLYGITKKQAKRVDTLIYTTLSDYDDCVWLERKETSNKAEAYAKCMIKEYDRLPGERRKDYILRCQELRRIDLKRQNLEIEYQLDNLWKSDSMKITDKIAMKIFANQFNRKFRTTIIDKIYKNKDSRLTLAESVENTESQFKDDIRTIAKNNKEKLREYFHNVEIDQVKIKSVEEIEKEDSTARNNRTLEDFAEQQRYEKAMNKKHEQDQKKMEKEEKKKIREASKRNKELEKEKQKQEARIEEELLGDNLYPKTKFNKDL